MQPAAVLFLDFDGVLHALECRSDQLFGCRPVLEEVLREFAEVHVVISSSWREARQLDDLRVLFSEDIRPRIVGMTPVLPFRSDVPHRQRECLMWLQANAPGTPWLAIDDVAELFEAGADELLLCDPACGFGRHQVPELRRRLARLVANARQPAAG